MSQRSFRTKRYLFDWGPVISFKAVSRRTPGIIYDYRTGAIASVAPALRQMTQLPHLDSRGIVPGEPVRKCRVEVRTAQWREVMDENRVAGTARNLGGKAQEGLGRVVGDAKTQVEGIANQVKGTAQDLYGQARDGASQIADNTAAAARRTASSFESTLRDTIETQPYTAVFVALGIGWLLGRMHRPL